MELTMNASLQLAVHCAKNYMHKSLRKIKVPLILGVWGGKGQGKTFQVTLAFKAMHVDPIIMSAGELEAGNAGEPAKLVRQRYREAGTLHCPPRRCTLLQWLRFPGLHVQLDSLSIADVRLRAGVL